MGLLDYDLELVKNKLSGLLGGGSVMDKPVQPEWQPEYQRFAGHALEAPMVSPDDLIGTGIPTKLAMLLKGGASATPLMAGAGMIKTAVGRIPETGAETGNLADMLQRAGHRAGYNVSRSDSAISPSRYVTFTKNGDELGESARQVRISNHVDKYPELADGIRTSVDPTTMVSFEQAANWLAREGFPTSLSARYKDTPTWERFFAGQAAERDKPENRLQSLIAAWQNKPKATRGPRPTLDDSNRLQSLRDAWKNKPQETRGPMPTLDDIR